LLWLRLPPLPLQPAARRGEHTGSHGHDQLTIHRRVQRNRATELRFLCTAVGGGGRAPNRSATRLHRGVSRHNRRIGTTGPALQPAFGELVSLSTAARHPQKLPL
jgi:hypothetical protein